MTIEVIQALFSLCMGLLLGSFLNVCIHRLPLKRSIVSPPSACPHCGEAVRFYDNIPIVSYLVLGGKCRACRHPLSWRYPVVEALTGLLSLALFIKFGWGLQYVLTLVFVLTLVVISFIDLEHQIIPDVLSFPGIVLGWLVSLLPGGVSWLDSLIGLVAGGGSLLLVAEGYHRLTGKEGMGGGDVKLLAMIGAWMGWRSLPLIVLFSSLFGALIGSVFLFVAGKGVRARIPFGPFLSLGALLWVFFGPELVVWYVSLYTG